MELNIQSVTMKCNRLMMIGQERMGGGEVMNDFQNMICLCGHRQAVICNKKRHCLRVRNKSFQIFGVKNAICNNEIQPFDDDWARANGRWYGK